MRPFKLCPVCGGEIIEKEVEKLLRGGNNIAVLTVSAEVCLHCGERFYSEETVQKFEKVRNNLGLNETKHFITLGQAYKVA